MDSHYLPHPDESRYESLWQEEPPLLFVLVVVIASADAQAQLASLAAQLKPTSVQTAYLFLCSSADQNAAAQIFAASSALPCLLAQSGERLASDSIYLVPYQSSATVHDGNVYLTPLSTENTFIQGTNALLESVALQHKYLTVAVNLGDQTSTEFASMSQVREAGGLALQALAAGRLQAADAIALTGSYDAVFSSDALPAELLRLTTGINPFQNSNNSCLNGETVQPVLTLLRTHLGIDLQGYCLSIICRRLHRRMLLRMKDRSTYYTLLQSSSTEVQKLGSDLLMPFTRFFRDAECWTTLSDLGLPRLFALGEGKPTRIWSAGCSTGEEAYSLAMLLVEHQTKTTSPVPFVIFGTDVDTTALLAARAGLYSHTIEQELSPERLKRFFIKEERGYRVVSELRDICIFSDHNLCFDAPLADVDLLVCRNTIGLFDHPLQEQAIVNILYALAPQGICMLGKADVTVGLDSHLTPLHAGHRLYFKAPTTMDRNTAQTRPQTAPKPQATDMESLPTQDMRSPVAMPGALQRYANSVVSTRFGPPGIIVDSSLNVIEIRGELAPFIQVSAGLASGKLQQLVKPVLASSIFDLVQQATPGNAPLSSNCLLPGFTESVTIEVLPLPTDSLERLFFLVLLQGGAMAPENAARNIVSPTRSSADSVSFVPEPSSSSSVIDADQQTNKEQESRREERTAAQRPIAPAPTLSLNEQRNSRSNAAGTLVQQAVQIEAEGPAHRVNAEVIGLIASSDIPLLLLTKDFVIRLLSPPMADILGLSPSDVGKVLTTLDLHLNDFGPIEPLLTEVLQTLRTHEQEVQDRQQHWFRLVIRPHRVTNEIRGLVVMLVDIDTERTLRHQLIHARDFAACILQQIPVPLAVLHADLSFRSANAAFQNVTGSANQILTGWSLQNFTQRFWGVSADETELHKLEALPIGGLIETEFSTRSAPGQTLLIKGQALLNGTARVVLLLVEDVTLRRETERLLARQQSALTDQLKNRDTLLKVTQKELHDLAQHLFTVQEQERERIASELHDDVSQRLSLLHMACDRLSQLHHPPAEAAEINSITQQVQSLASDVRVMSHNLHPALLKQLGLVVALKSLVDDFREKENLPATLTSTIGALQPSDLASTTCYRVVQEALRNVAKHAGQTHVKISLDSMDDLLRLQIRDFGNGFDQGSSVPQSGLGLTSMRERTRIAGGTFSITSTLGEGTVIVAEVPAGIDA